MENIPLEQYGIDLDVAKTYRERLVEHIDCVRLAGVEIGVEWDQLDQHDRSKWSMQEFPAYAKNFCGDGDPEGFASAWLHHIHYNPHHWQHWIYPDGFTPKNSSVENGTVQMPEHFALEMIADWIGASKAYTGDWDMTDWLLSHVGGIRVHSKTAKYLTTKLKEIGYNDVMIKVEFAAMAKL